MAGTKRKLSEGHLDQYVSNANEVIFFKFVKKKEDMEDEADSFNPEFTHQFFGDSENIFGYIGLQIRFYYSACNLIPYFSMKYREKVKPSKTGGLEADDVYKIICEKLELEPCTDLDFFKSSLDKESSFVPLGKLVSSFEIQIDDDIEEFSVYRADTTVPGFKKYHENMQTLILWFIDAASYILDDERWDYFVLHKHVKGEKEMFPFIGFATVYRYYAYPKMVRPRISQMLVLPTFQKRGLGSKMLEGINSWYIKDPDVLDITVEDPSDDFVRIRDYVDCKSCQTMPSFSEENIRKGFSKDMFEDARKKFKINKKQSRRVYEILRLKCTDINNTSEYKAYRLDIKNRLNAPYQRELLDMEKLAKSLAPDEIKAATNPIPQEQRIEKLDLLYKELEEKYKAVIERLLDDE